MIKLIDVLHSLLFFVVFIFTMWFLNDGWFAEDLAVAIVGSVTHLNGALVARRNPG